MGQNLRVMLDTNIYDFLIEKGAAAFLESLKNSKHVTVYGNKVIRDELRDTPKDRKFKGKSARTLLINTYDFVVGKHNLDILPIMLFLAEKYWGSYSGAQPYNKIINDFLIVACASFKELDIVCTADRRTMKSKSCLRIYKAVNSENGLPTPRFIEFNEFEKMV